MITIKEYAESRNKSVQSVYKQLKRDKNKDRLKGHLFKKDRTTYLDDVAIEILNESKNDIVIIDDQKQRNEFIELKKENKIQRNKIESLQDELNIKNNKLLILQEQMTALLLDNKEKTLLLEQKQEQFKEIERLKTELEREKNKGFFYRLFGKRNNSDK